MFFCDILKNKRKKSQGQGQVHRNLWKFSSEPNFESFFNEICRKWLYKSQGFRVIEEFKAFGSNASISSPHLCSRI